MHGKKVYQRWDLKIDGIILTNRNASSGLNSEWPPVQKEVTKTRSNHLAGQISQICFLKSKQIPVCSKHEQIIGIKMSKQNSMAVSFYCSSTDLFPKNETDRFST